MVKGMYPTSIKEAACMKAEFPKALLITGGTDVMVVKKTADEIIFLNNVADMKQVKDEKDCISIGAAVCYSDLILDPLVPEMLKQAIRNIASPAIRSAGTLAGNICNASPAGDSLPVLYALDAIVVAASCVEGEIKLRKIAIKDFILGIRKIDLKDTEIVVAIEIPKSFIEKKPSFYYEKVGARKSEAISKLSFIGTYTLDKDAISTKEVISDIRIAFGSVGITALRFNNIEKKLVGKSKEEIKTVKDEIVDEYMQNIHPIDDQRSTAEYRLTICRNLLNDFLGF